MVYALILCPCIIVLHLETTHHAIQMVEARDGARQMITSGQQYVVLLRSDHIQRFASVQCCLIVSSDCIDC